MTDLNNQENTSVKQIYIYIYTHVPSKEIVVSLVRFKLQSVGIFLQLSGLAF